MAVETLLFCYLECSRVLSVISSQNCHLQYLGSHVSSGEWSTRCILVFMSAAVHIYSTLFGLLSSIRGLNALHLLTFVSVVQPF